MADMDFIGFTYNGKHSWRDLGIYRTSDGSRYNESLTSSLNDKTTDVPGGDGQYYFGTLSKNKTFSVSYAFDQLSEAGLRQLKQIFDGKGIHELIFDETPYKVWSAKVTGNASIKHICFTNSEGQRVYKGEGSLTFTCYYPYAHTPDWVWVIDNNGEYSKKAADGRRISSYDVLAYPTKSEWNQGAGLTDSVNKNLGDVEAPFVVTNASGQVTVGDLTVNIQGVGTWDSSTGLVIDANGVVLPTTGKSYGAIQPGQNASTKVGVLSYKYWYY